LPPIRRPRVLRSEVVGDAAGVLIRGIEGISGPGRVAAALGIDASLCGREARLSSGLWFEAAEWDDAPPRIKRTTRMGVDYAGPLWAVKKLRFIRVRKRSQADKVTGKLRRTTRHEMPRMRIWVKS
jgi:3-methyladenine DNA glycosylase Mpg